MRSKSGRNFLSSGILHIITTLVKMESAWEETEIMSSLWSSSLPKWLWSETRGWKIKHSWNWRRIEGGLKEGCFYEMVDLSITILISLEMWKHGFGHIEIIQYALFKIISLQSQLQCIIRQVDQNISVVLFLFFPWCTHSRDAQDSLILLRAGQGRE